MKLTKEQKEAVTTFLREKIETLVDYQLINEELTQLVFEKMTDSTQNNAFLFLQQLDKTVESEKANWKLARRHCLLDETLKANAHGNLFNLFSLMHYEPGSPGGEYVTTLKKEHKINFKDAEVREEIKSIFRAIWHNDAVETLAMDVEKESIKKIELPEEEKVTLPFPLHPTTPATITPVAPVAPEMYSSSRKIRDEATDALIAKRISEEERPKSTTAKAYESFIDSFFKTRSTTTYPKAPATITPAPVVPEMSSSSRKSSEADEATDALIAKLLSEKAHPVLESFKKAKSEESPDPFMDSFFKRPSKSTTSPYYPYPMPSSTTTSTSTHTSHKAPGTITYKSLSGSDDLTLDGDIVIEGDVSGTGTITSRNGSITIGGNASGSRAIHASLNIIINGNKSGTGMVRSHYGSITMRKDLLGAGDVSANLGITIIRNVSGTGTVESKTGAVWISGAVSGSRDIIAAQEIHIREGKSGTGNITSSYGQVSLGGDLGGSGDIVAYQSAIITGNKSGTCSVTSHHGDVVVKGSISGSGKLSAPNGTAPKPKTSASTSSIYSTALPSTVRKDIWSPRSFSSSTSMSDIRVGKSYINKCSSDGSVSMINGNTSVKQASRLELIQDGRSLTIDNLGVRTVTMDGDKITGLLAEANVIFNGMRLIPSHGIIDLNEYASSTPKFG